LGVCSEGAEERARRSRARALAASVLRGSKAGDLEQACTRPYEHGLHAYLREGKNAVGTASNAPAADLGLASLYSVEKRWLRRYHRANMEEEQTLELLKRLITDPTFRAEFVKDRKAALAQFAVSAQAAAIFLVLSVPELEELARVMTGEKPVA
jgi:hypothetical protein